MAAMDLIDEIKRLYYEATKETIDRDLTRAIDILKSLPSDEARERAAVYMDGLAEMRKEWRPNRPKGGPRKTKPPRESRPGPRRR
jgi:hypothetical protein